jgi:hypothetical protein
VRLEPLMNRRTRELHASTRSEIWMSIGAALFFVAVIAWRFASDHQSFPVIGVGVVVAWIVISLYWFRDRMGPAPGDAMAATSRDYYRKEMERRRDHLRNAWLWHGPLVLACVTFLASVEANPFRGLYRLRSVMPLVGLLVLWIGFGIVRRRRQANQLQREIDEIDTGGQ